MKYQLMYLVSMFTYFLFLLASAEFEESIYDYNSYSLISLLFLNIMKLLGINR